MCSLNNIVTLTNDDSPFFCQEDERMKKKLTFATMDNENIEIKQHEEHIGHARHQQNKEEPGISVPIHLLLSTLLLMTEYKNNIMNIVERKSEHSNNKNNSSNGNCGCQKILDVIFGPFFFFYLRQTN